MSDDGAPVGKKRRPARSRHDRSAKLSKRKHTTETVVKCSLRRALVGDDAQKDMLVDAFRARVAACSRRTVLASVAANLAAREAFDGRAVFDAAVPDLQDLTLIRQLMLGTDGAVFKSAVAESLHQRHPELLHDPRERHLADRNVYSAAAIKMRTNFRNHLSTNLLRVVKKAVYDCSGPGSRDERVSMLFQVCGWPRRGAAPPLSVRQAAFVAECRRVLGLAESGGALVDDEWRSDPQNFAAMLRFFVHVSRLIDAAEQAAPADARPARRFTLLPVCTVKAHFITVDTHTLHGIARDAAVVGPDCSGAAFLGNRDAHWSSLVDHARLLPRGGTFTGTVETDGVSICIHYVRPKPSPSPGATRGGARKGKAATVTPRPADIAAFVESHRIVGIDPGRSNIYFAAENLAGGSVVTRRLTRGQYYGESGISAALRRTRRWLQPLQPELEALAAASPKGASLASFEAFVAVHVAGSAARWVEALRPRWAQQRLRLHGGKQRVFARFFDELQRAGAKHGDDRPLAVAYGSAGFPSGGRGEAPVPTTSAYKACARRFPTFAVDEFRTTKVHHEDDSVLQTVARRRRSRRAAGGFRLAPVRGLLWCSSTRQASKFVNRDRNAALNILRCFVSAERPAMLDRSRCTGRIRQQMGRVIRR